MRKPHRIPVNAADAPEDGDYIVPSVVRRGEPLPEHLYRWGNNPMLAARLAAEQETSIWAGICAFMWNSWARCGSI